MFSNAVYSLQKTKANSTRKTNMARRRGFINTSPPPLSMNGEGCTILKSVYIMRQGQFNILSVVSIEQVHLNIKVQQPKNHQHKNSIKANESRTMRDAE